MMQVEWIKIRVDMFEDEKMKLIQALPEGDAITSMWVRLLTMAGKTNDDGYIYLKEGTPYTPQMLSIIFSKPQPVVELALRTFIDFGMIEVDNKGIYICNWEKHQNIDGLDKIRKQTKERVQKHRERKREEQLTLPEPVTEECNVTVTQSNATELELETELDTDIDKEKEIDKKKCRRKSSEDDLSEPIIQDIWNHYFQTFEGFFSRLTLTENRKKVIGARLKDKHPEKIGEFLFSMDDIKLAISNIRQSTFHCGDNEKKKFYAHIDFICRNAEMVEKWMNETPKPQQQKVIPFNSKQQEAKQYDGFSKSSESNTQSTEQPKGKWDHLVYRG